MLRISDCIRGSVGIDVPEPPERQGIGNAINAAFVFARTDFVKVDARAVPFATSPWLVGLHSSRVF